MTKDEITNVVQLTEKILENDEDIIVPVRRVLNVLKSQNIENIPSFEELCSILKSDERFDYFVIKEDFDISAVNNEESEILSGPRVKLKKITLTPEKMGEILNRKIDNMLSAMLKAWETRPKGDAVSELRLLEIISKIKDLKDKMQENFSNLKDSDKRETKN